MMRYRKIFRSMLTTTMLIALVAGCGSSKDQSSSSSQANSLSTTVLGGSNGAKKFLVKKDSSLSAKASKVVTDGTLKLVTDPSTPPYSFTQDGTSTLRGSDIDLGNAIGAKLGLKVEWSSAQFAGILAAIQSKRYDFAMSAVGDTPKREESVDFVDYSTDSNAVIVPDGNPHKISSIDDLCGLKIAVLEGSVMLGTIKAVSCPVGKAMSISIFQDLNSALLQVKTGRADATLYQTGVALYLTKTSDAAKGLQVLTNKVYGEGYNAIPFNKDSSELRDLVQNALEKLKSEGVYKDILASYNLTPNALEKFTKNDGERFNQNS